MVGLWIGMATPFRQSFQLWKRIGISCEMTTLKPVKRAWPLILKVGDTLTVTTPTDFAGAKTVTNSLPNGLDLPKWVSDTRTVSRR